MDTEADQRAGSGDEAADDDNSVGWINRMGWDELIEFSESMSEWADYCVGGRNEILFGLISTCSGNN